jgi:hypothetical protein
MEPRVTIVILIWAPKRPARLAALKCMPAGEAVVEDDDALSDSLPETPIEKVVVQPTRGT